MEVIPGIDLIDGKCVCAVHMPFAKTSAFSHDPVEIAKLWADQGAKRFYVADLDGARMGRPVNLESSRKIIEATGLPVDLGGGVRTVETARQLLDVGVDRIVVGTSAALENDLAVELFGVLAEKTILSIASLNGYVAVRDWQARTDEPAEAFGKRMCDLGAKRVVFTDVSRKGMHGGVNVASVRRIAQALNVAIIASGGVSSLEDIRELKALAPLGVEGVVVVTAIYSGAINLAEAIAAAE